MRDGRPSAARRPEPRAPSRAAARESGTDARRGRARLVLGAIVAFVLAALAGIYATQIQPGSLIPVDPIEIVVPEEPGPHRLFVYGTLRSPLVRFVVTGRVRSTETASLPGFRRVGRDIAYDPESQVEGLVVYVSTSELRRLDRYERTGQRYERVELVLDDGDPAWVYRMLPNP
jgi:gamma-glutamylcyclotransferase (GGCT)/AIG2-like uncharacterized protein YtfP